MLRPIDLRIGIDVGGTNTDAVILDRHNKVLAKTKNPTTADVSEGIADAVTQVLQGADAPRERITHAMLGTTHATNAVLSRRGLGRVAVVRVAGPASHAIPPLTAWPAPLRRAVSAGEVILDGEVEYDGREAVPLDADALRAFLKAHASDGRIDAVAITGVFSPVSDRHEKQAADVVRDVLGEVPVVLSSEMGTIGLLDRENSAVLNASLINPIGKVARGFVDSLSTLGIDAQCYFVQNDGTLVPVDYVTEHPVLTIGSGPANSLRGAAFLAGVSDGLVIDIGGTSADVGALVNGFPRESSLPVDVGGVRTNFRMPDLLSIAIGGGSILSRDGDGQVRVGPESVGKDLHRQALCFGGDVPTLTDAAVLLGRADIGTAAPGGAVAGLAHEAMRAADLALREAIDRMKLSRREEPLLAVGGGSFLLEESPPGVSAFQRPAHYEVANAVGAAIATVGSSTDRLYALDGRGREGALEEARATAMDGVIRLGGDPERASIIDIEEIQLTYLPTPVTRIRIKAAAPLRGV